MIVNILENYPWGKPTDYVYKIYAGLAEKYRKHYWYGVLLELDYDSDKLNDWQGVKKVHQMVDQNLYDQIVYEPGELIHFVLNRDRGNQFRFCPPVYVMYLQEVEIVWTRKKMALFIDGMRINGKSLEFFVNEEGFDSLEEFQRSYPKDFYGTVLYWEYEGF